jgi:hypothetical protein
VRTFNLCALAWVVSGCVIETSIPTSASSLATSDAAASSDAPLSNSSRSDARTGSPQERGAALVRASGCPTCHDPGDQSLSGQTSPRPGTMSYAANLTPDHETGIGDWSDEDIVRAVRTGIDDEGRMLCPPMPHFSFTDAEAADLVAFLRSLRPVSHAIPGSDCGEGGSGGSGGDGGSGGTGGGGGSSGSGGSSGCGESEPNNTQLTANPLCPQNTATGTIWPAGDVDYFTWAVPANKTYTVQLTDLHADYTMTLYKISTSGAIVPVGTATDAHDLAPQSLSFHTSDGGTYLLGVRGVAGASAQDHPYSVSVRY